MSSHPKKSIKPHKKSYLKINRRNFLLFLIFVSITLIILSSVFLAYSYRTPTSISIVKTIRYAEFSILSNTKFVAKPALIYDYHTIIEGTKAYYNLVKEAIIKITLNSKIYPLSNIGSPRKVRINFANSAYIETNEWSKEIIINSSIIDNDPRRYVIEFRLNLTNISELVNRINNEINKMIYEYKIVIIPTLLVTVFYDNNIMKNYTINPSILININRNANTISIDIDNVQKQYVEKKTIDRKNFLNPIRTSVSEARLYSLTSVSLFSSLALGLTFYYFHKYGLRTKRSNLLEKYEKYIIRGKVETLGDKPVINIRDFKILVGVAKMYKKPIIYDEKSRTFYIIMSDTIYSFYEAKDGK